MFRRAFLFISATKTSRNITTRVIERDVNGGFHYFLEESRGVPISPTWSSKMMPTWLYRQDFAKFSLTRHYNLSRDEEKNFPSAAPVLRENFYNDNVLCGAASLMEAKALKNQLSGILKKGGVELHKWGSSHPKLASNIIGDYEFENPIETKTVFGVLKSTRSTSCLLREPKSGIVSLEVFNSVSSICIGRCIVHPQATRVELPGFADASEKFYGAVIYCRSIARWRNNSEACNK
ncbi:uncharacterized protein TNCV_2531011 [Trichonephila clavipes]|nr:uncharacterized protein TNCV_2531011 [Trichonephila clavipes]